MHTGLLQVKEDLLVTQQRAWELEKCSNEEEGLAAAAKSRQQQLQREIDGKGAGLRDGPDPLRALQSLAQAYKSHIFNLQAQVDSMTVVQGGPSAEEEVATMERRASELLDNNRRLQLEHQEAVEALDTSRRRHVADLCCTRAHTHCLVLLLLCFPATTPLLLLSLPPPTPSPHFLPSLSHSLARSHSAWYRSHHEQSRQGKLLDVAGLPPLLHPPSLSLTPSRMRSLSISRSFPFLFLFRALAHALVRFSSLVLSCTLCARARQTRALVCSSSIS
jgi:hypothetical protein